MPAAPQIVVELVTRNEPRADPAGNRLQLAVTDQCANVVLGAAELAGNFANRQGRGPFHTWSIARAGGSEVVNPAGAWLPLRSRANGCDDLCDGIEHDVRPVAHDVVAAAVCEDGSPVW